MQLERTTFRMSIIVFLIVLTANNMLGKTLEAAGSSEDSEENSSHNPWNDDWNVVNETTATDASIETNADSPDPPKCAERHKVCRTFGPLPLPCCGEYVCKVTYGEQHCVEKDFTAT